MRKNKVPGPILGGLPDTMSGNPSRKPYKPKIPKNRTMQKFYGAGTFRKDIPITSDMTNDEVIDELRIRNLWR